jgi:hypothetical protein
MLINAEYLLPFLPRTPIHMFPLWDMFLIQGRQSSEMIAFLLIEFSCSLEVVCQSSRCIPLLAMKTWKNVWPTLIHSFPPIPISVVIIQHVLTMSIVHLSHVGANLICFWPSMFSCFTMKMAHTIYVGACIEIHTSILVTLDMECWYGPTGPLHKWCQVWEELTEATGGIYWKLAGTVIGCDSIYVIFLGTKRGGGSWWTLTKGSGKGKVNTCVSDNRINNTIQSVS